MAVSFHALLKRRLTVKNVLKVLIILTTAWKIKLLLVPMVCVLPSSSVLLILTALCVVSMLLVQRWTLLLLLLLLLVLTLNFGIMYLQLERCRHNKHGTFGELFLCDGSSCVHLAFTLEPSFESRDLFGSLPIEDGDYKLSVTMSPRFHKLLPLVHHPSRQGIRIHEGNTVSDTSGCILLGLFDEFTKITFSKFALNYVLSVINQFSINTIKITSLYGKVPNF